MMEAVDKDGLPLSAPKAFRRAVVAENDRALDVALQIIQRWPAWRKHAACMALGFAVGFADRMGVDAEGFIAELRSKHPRADEIIPPGDPS